MKYAVVGAGVIGITYAWLLSDTHEVTLVTRPGRVADLRQGVTLHVRDLRRRHPSGQFAFHPRVSEVLPADADGVLVTVDARGLPAVLPRLTGLSADVILLLNHPDLRAEVERFLPRGAYLVGFPGQVGGGRRGNDPDVTIFRSGTMLGPTSSVRAQLHGAAFEAAGLNVREERDPLGWLRVHQLQQAVTAGALLTAGSYDALVADHEALADLVSAWREGVAVLAAAGVDARRHVPGFLGLPRPVVAPALAALLGGATTRAMVTGHARHGMGEWVAGYLAVSDAGRRLGVPTLFWDRYRPAVEAWRAAESGLR